jgi:hypothetical protein
VAWRRRAMAARNGQAPGSPIPGNNEITASVKVMLPPLP